MGTARRPWEPEGGKDTLRFRRPFRLGGFSTRPLRSPWWARPLSVPPGVVRVWNDVRRQRGGEAEGDEGEQADDPERMGPGGLGDCQ